MLLSNTHVNILHPATDWNLIKKFRETPNSFQTNVQLKQNLHILSNFWTIIIQWKQGLHTGIEHPFLLIFTELLLMFETFSLGNPLMGHITVAQVEPQLQQGLLRQALPIFTFYQDAKNYTKQQGLLWQTGDQNQVWNTSCLLEPQSPCVPRPRAALLANEDPAPSCAGHGTSSMFH